MRFLARGWLTATFPPTALATIAKSEVGQRPPAARAGEGADAVERGGADEDVVAARAQIDMNGGVRQGCISAECNRYRGRAVAVPLNCFSKLKFRSACCSKGATASSS